MEATANSLTSHKQYATERSIYSTWTYKIWTYTNLGVNYYLTSISTDRNDSSHRVAGHSLVSTYKKGKEVRNA